MARFDDDQGPRVLEREPLNAETPLPALAAEPTPARSAFVRTHFAVPALDVQRYALRIDGAVERPATLSFAQIAALPARRVRVALECAGNGRAALQPAPEGVRWGFGAVGDLVFEGTPLREVLLGRAGGLLPSACEILFEGADAGEVEPGLRASFARSLPREKALDPDTLLAWAMNGAPLAPEHGFPLRLVVPGWYGVASVKWLVQIRALTEPFAGYFQTTKYVYDEGRGGSPPAPVGAARVRALIVAPPDGAVLEPGRPVLIRGLAWAGANFVERVELLIDGEPPREVTLRPPPGGFPQRWAPVRWQVEWTPPPGGRAAEYTLRARAWDSGGNAQPLEPYWNVQGYGNNGVQPVRVRVGAGAEIEVGIGGGGAEPPTSGR